MTASWRRILAAALVGVAGTAALLALCLWQLDRLEWKRGLIAELSERLAAGPVALPDPADPTRDEFLRVRLTGRFEGLDGSHGHPDAPFLTTFERRGAGYRIIQPLTLDDGRRVLVSRGWVPLEAKNQAGAAVRPTPAPEGEVEIVGALRFPQETGDPAFSATQNVWVARDLAVLSEVFDAEPVLVVAETPTPGPSGEAPLPTPLTVDVPNDHLGYALTWGLLAAAWAGMSGFLVWREWRRA